MNAVLISLVTVFNSFNKVRKYYVSDSFVRTWKWNFASFQNDRNLGSQIGCQTNIK